MRTEGHGLCEAARMTTANIRARGPASAGELRLAERVEIRDCHGSLIRIVSGEQASELIARGCACVVGSKRVEYIRVDVDCTHGAGPSVTTKGYRAETKDHHPRCIQWGEGA